MFTCTTALLPRTLIPRLLFDVSVLPEIVMFCPLPLPVEKSANDIPAQSPEMLPVPSTVTPLMLAVTTSVAVLPPV